MTVQEAVDYCRTHIKLAPITSVGGLTGKPALQLANQVKSKIIARSYAWQWNRASIPSFLTVDNTDEYPLIHSKVDDIGWLERAYLQREDDTSTPPGKYQIEVAQSIPRSSDIGMPDRVAIERDQYGVDCLRFNRSPRGNDYRIFIDYQKKPSQITALTDTFFPIPYDLDPVIQQFFLSFAYNFVDNKRAYLELQRAEQLLREQMMTDDTPQESTQFVPERSLFWG